jgi:hypothetical protein
MVTACLLVLFSMHPAGPIEIAPAGDPQMHKGTVVSAGDGRLVMKDSAGKEQSYSVDTVTKITVNGKPGRLEDLQETMPVQVTTDEKGKVLAVSTMDKDKRTGLVFLTAGAVDRIAGDAAFSQPGWFGTN